MLKKISLFLLLGTAILHIGFAQSSDFSSDKKVSFAIGVLLAKSLQDSGITVDFPAFTDGLQKTLVSGNPGITFEAAAEIVQTAVQVVLDKQREENLKKSEEFLAQNKKKSGIHLTKSGLQYEIINKGKGAQPKQDSVVVVHYTGSLIDGTVFDNSREREEPATIPLENVIPGWAEGIQLMHTGGRYKFYIPPDLAYGKDSPADEIPPNSVLVFDVELLEIEHD
ncbi:MAG: FKBP-type peptidyl-prolyl cis-trans isomerase [Spirochaetaceae bacterium]|jgi:FKBP-type peptidyl-prolyl cis-trans isomerase|nr:FKBP-type peptidyl-prolyl cis-trans isomerase [Spirochaetaceae bacterium]